MILAIEEAGILGIVIRDAGYGHNTSFLLKIENRNLKYWGGLAKNPKVLASDQEDSPQIIRLDELAQSLLRTQGKRTLFPNKN